jgi:hypothetical protein
MTQIAEFFQIIKSTTLPREGGLKKLLEKYNTNQ